MRPYGYSLLWNIKRGASASLVSAVVYKEGDYAVAKVWDENNGKWKRVAKSIDHASVIQQALDSGASSIFIKSGTYTLKRALLPNNNQIIMGEGYNTVLKLLNEIRALLTEDVPAGQNYIVVDDASNFEVGMEVFIYDPTTPKIGWNATYAYITKIEGNTIYLDRSLNDTYTVSNNSAISNQIPLIKIGWYPDFTRSRVIISNLRLDGNKDNRPNDRNDAFRSSLLHAENSPADIIVHHVWAENSTSDGISYQHVSNGLIYGCFARNNAKNGFHIGSSSVDVVVRDCVGENNYWGFYFCASTENIVVDSCAFNSNSDFGMYFGADNKYWRITNCVFKDNASKGISCSGSNNTDGIIRNCIFRNNEKGGISLINNRVSIVGCIFDTNGGTSYNSIDVNNASNCLIEENLIMNSGAYGIRLYSGTSECIVRRNIFINNPLGAIKNEGNNNTVRLNYGYTTESHGTVTITGDGSTKEFSVDVEHGLISDNVSVSVSSTRPTTAPPSYIFAYLVDNDNDGFYETIRITVKFDTAPADGDVIKLFWKAEVVS